MRDPAGSVAADNPQPWPTLLCLQDRRLPLPGRGALWRRRVPGLPRRRHEASAPRRRSARPGESDVAVRRRRRRDEQWPRRGWCFEERGDQNGLLVGWVEGGVDVAVADVDERRSRRVRTLLAVVGGDEDQLALGDVDDHGA